MNEFMIVPVLEHDNCPIVIVSQSGRDQDLALDFVWNRDHHGLRNTGMLLEPFLHFAGIDVLAAAYEHVIDTPDEIVEAARIAAHHVTGVVPAVPDPDRRLSRQIEITRGDGPAPDPQPALVLIWAPDQLEFGFRHGIADRKLRSEQAF